MTTLKAEAVSVRAEPRIKAALQQAAEREMRGVANMVEVMVVAYGLANAYPSLGVPDKTLFAFKPGQSSL